MYLDGQVELIEANVGLHLGKADLMQNCHS